ncbi:MAG: hypothetical protein DI587_31380 [Variovorax paradoxus]|nr:MAG: hypothetical protein DI583_31380 [Variovorax paradoxus]PZQ03163.1 MAG: hypothetical protein DI587_31380 [Variovorax paradoxus]
MLGIYSQRMHSPETRAQLEQCRAVVADADVDDELRQLGMDLIGHLLAMHAEQRLNSQILLLALQSLELVPGLEDAVQKLRAAANREDIN